MQVSHKLRVGAFGIQCVELSTEIGWDIKMKKLSWLGPYFSKPMGVWDAISYRPGTNPAN